MRKLQLAVLCLLAGIAIGGAAAAQDDNSPAPPSSGASFTPDQLDQLVAPVALYPDPLLADVLTASTYPLEVVDADRWANDPQNSGLSGDELTEALNARGWDPSVQSLAPFPETLQLMDSHLDWTETLGEAFLAQPGDVMDAVQRMRERAQLAGNLPSNGEEAVTDQGGVIGIAPPADLIYVPQYDPWCAFGDWPYAVGAPFYFSNWSGNCDPVDYSVVFGPGVGWPFSYWSWGYFDWRGHRVLIRADKYSQFHPDQMPKNLVWRHDRKHRGAVRYRDARNARTFGQPVAPPSSPRMTATIQSARSQIQVRHDNPGRAFRPPPHRRR